MEGFSFGPFHPPGISSLSSYFPLSTLAVETPSPSLVPVTFHGVGMVIFWNHSLPGARSSTVLSLYFD